MRTFPFVALLLGLVAACAARPQEDAQQASEPLPQTDPNSMCPDLVGIYRYFTPGQNRQSAISYVGGSSLGMCMPATLIDEAARRQ